MNSRHLMSVKRLWRSLFTNNARSRRYRRLPMVQSLECPTLLASVMDSGTTLQIELELSERLHVESTATAIRLLQRRPRLRIKSTGDDAATVTLRGTAAMQIPGA